MRAGHLAAFHVRDAGARPYRWPRVGTQAADRRGRWRRRRPGRTGALERPADL